MIAGWYSNSGYSLLCVLPALAQTISYEVTLAFILLSFVILICTYNLVYFYAFQVYLWLILFSLPLSFILVYFLFG
jgi:NADH-ubiquinone oxidoreductase chain 1